ADRRFISVNGSAYCPFATSAPKTVVGTVAGIQPAVSTPGFDSASPLAPTVAPASIRQPASSGPLLRAPGVHRRSSARLVVGRVRKPPAGVDGPRGARAAGGGRRCR